MSDKTRTPNRLAQENSPYLQQHAYNPVDWFPWGEEALQQAREKDLPILLSIGYSACHWCHVMERESFEDPRIAELMNENFVNVKVDREERPDIDAIYMNYVQMTTGSGGWPLTVFLTPEQIPYYGGTYFPPQDHFGRPAFRRVLESVASAYRTRRKELEEISGEIVRRLEQASSFNAPRGEIDPAVPGQAVERLEAQFDRRFGGFGAAPKFPSTMALGFLLRQAQNTDSPPTREMVTFSLDKMAAGGIYDQLGGGFHRYAVDDHWLVPHFEKMLYDNALLVRLYLETWQVTRKPRYRQVVEETLQWVIREMSHDSGGFYSAQDADSEGEEGRYYIWTRDEVEQELGEIADVFCDFFDITRQGNFEGSSILNRRFTLKSFAQQKGMQVEKLSAVLEEARGRLLSRRARRVSPGTDDKILTAWNGLMNSAFSLAGFALDRPDLTDQAFRNGEFLWREMRTPEGELRRSWKDGKAKLKGYVEDYANTCEAFIDLFCTSGQAVWLERGQQIQDKQLELFWDEEDKDFFFTASNHEELLVRHKEHLDNATPSGNSTSCRNLLRLSQLVGRTDYREKAEEMLGKLGPGMSSHPLAFGNWLQALDFYLHETIQLVLGGEDQSVFLGPLRRRFLPHALLFRITPESAHLPLAEGRSASGPPKAYVCRGFECDLPSESVEQFEERLTP